MFFSVYPHLFIYLFVCLFYYYYYYYIIFCFVLVLGFLIIFLMYCFTSAAMASYSAIPAWSEMNKQRAAAWAELRGVIAEIMRRAVADTVPKLYVTHEDPDAQGLE